MDKEDKVSLDKNPFVCGLCNDDFDKIENYYSHFKQHGVLFTRMFPACCKDYVSLHNEGHTELQSGYTCSSCQHRFSTVCLLHNHLLQCSNNSGSYFYDHQQMAACPVDSCIVSIFRNEIQESCGDIRVISEENQECSIDVTVNSDVTIKQEDETGENKTKNEFTVLVKNENNKTDAQFEDLETCRKINSVILPRDLRESFAKRIKTELNAVDRESTVIVKVKRNTHSRNTTKNSLIQRKKKSLNNKKVSRLKARKKRARENLKGENEHRKCKSSNVKKRKKPAGDSNMRPVVGKSCVPVTDDDSDLSCDNDPDYNDEDDKNDSDNENSDEHEENKPSEVSQKSKYKRVRTNNSLKQSSHRTMKANNRSRQNKIQDKASEDDLRCEFCGKAFTTVRECKTHTRTHRSCLICSKKYQHLRALRIHMRSHDDVQPWPCSICGRGFTERRSLQSHMITHTDDKPHRCDTCGASYKHQQTLKIHVRSHSKVKPFCCEICGSGFVDWCTLKRHKIHKHTDDRPFKCPHCNAGFKDNYKLSRHILTHSDVKPHQCEVCGRQMSTKSSLAVHMKKHEARQLYECSECSRQFVSKYILKDHQRTHTGEKPYKCPSCPKAHIKRAELRKHMLKHHNVDLDNLDIYPSRKHIIMGKVSASAASQFDDSNIQAKIPPDNPPDAGDRDSYPDNPPDAGDRDGCPRLGEAPMDLSFLSDMVESAPHLAMGNKDQQQLQGLTLMSL